uniref:Cnidarian restricted protein n=1 Tax=Clytia hemisphaerica TaxID=252671 RepID=A0A7M5WSX1_9CNID
MYNRPLLSTILLILPTLNLACNFTEIDPITPVHKPLQLTIHTTGFVTRNLLGDPLKYFKSLPEKLVYKKEAKPGVMDSILLSLPVGLICTINVYLSGTKNISFAYNFVEDYRGDVTKPICTRIKYTYELNQTQDFVYSKAFAGDHRHIRTYYILKFKLEDMKSSGCYRNVPQSFILLGFNLFVICFCVF